MAENENQVNDNEQSGSKIRGIVQKIIGEIEEVGGALTGDPTTQAEGQFNVEVGEIREELAEGEFEQSDTDDSRV
jgi:uncharacterized protein YjbJ (UPF0337 family)